MAKNHTKIEAAVEKLIASIQKECEQDVSEKAIKENEKVITKAQNLLKAAKENSIKELLNGLFITHFLGLEWVEKHPGVITAIVGLEIELKKKI